MSKFAVLQQAAQSGDPQATSDLFAVVYNELRQLAVQRLSHERPGQTLQPTALVHEVYLRLIGDLKRTSHRDGAYWEGQAQFFAAAALAMRRILVEIARSKKRIKRGGQRTRQPLDPEHVAAPELAGELIDLDEALVALAKVEPKIAELVMLRYFGGLTLKESAAMLEIAPRTADAHWAYARAWLLSHIRGSGNASI